MNLLIFIKIIMGATASSLVEEAWAPILGRHADTAQVRSALARIRAASSSMRLEVGAEGIAGGIQRIFHEDAVGLPPAIKVEAAETLEKLCRVPENRPHIMESNYGPDLCMALLQSTAEAMDLKVHVLATIAHLACDDANRRPLVHEGLLEVVISELGAAFNAITAKRMFGAGPQAAVHSREQAAGQAADRARAGAQLRLANRWLVNGLAAFTGLASNAVVATLALDKGALPALTRAARCDSASTRRGRAVVAHLWPICGPSVAHLWPICGEANQHPMGGLCRSASWSVIRHAPQMHERRLLRLRLHTC